MTLHTIDPVWDENSKVLILGSFPSVKSREEGFFYGHKQNRFWRVLASVCDCSVPQNIDEKKSMLLANGIAVWDVIHSCDIVGSSDSSIKNVVPADIERVVANSKIQNIYANGGTAKKLYEKYSQKKNGREIIGLPSTSPANAAFTMDRLLEKWKVISPYFHCESPRDPK